MHAPTACIHTNLARTIWAGITGWVAPVKELTAFGIWALRVDSVFNHPIIFAVNCILLITINLVENMFIERRGVTEVVVKLELFRVISLHFGPFWWLFAIYCETSCFTHIIPIIFVLLNLDFIVVFNVLFASFMTAL